MQKTRRVQPLIKIISNVHTDVKSTEWLKFLHDCDHFGVKCKKEEECLYLSKSLFNCFYCFIIWR